MRLKKILRSVAVVSVLCCGVLFADETPKPLTIEQLEAIAIQPAQKFEATNSRVVPEMLPLFKAESITYTGKKRYKDTKLGFRLHVPEKMEDGKKYPLILWLHGTGEAGNDNQDQLVHLHHIITYLTGPKKRDFFLLVPQTPEDHRGWDAYEFYSSPSVLGNLFGNAQPRREQEPFEDSPLGFSFAMLDQVVKDYPVDPDRIMVSGLSSGGDGTWRALERRPEQFAAAVPLVSWSALKDEAIAKDPILKKIPIWAIYSSDDNGIDEARADFARVEAAGCNVKKSEFGVCGHNAWTPAMLQADIFSWLLSRAKKDGEYVAVVDANVNPEDMKGIVDVATRVPGSPIIAPNAPAAPKDETAVPSPARQLLEKLRTESVPEPPGAIAQMSSPLTLYPQAVNSAVSVEKDGLYAQLANRYLQAKDAKSFKQVFAKLSGSKKAEVLAGILMSGLSMQPDPVITLKEIEALVDEIADAPTTATTPIVVSHQERVLSVPYEAPKPEVREGSTPGSKIVEECDREWAMTSESLYGMFPADWDKEGKQLPEFVVKSTAAELKKTLEGDVKKLQAVCKSILGLEHRPMSSPWFETGGGRLRGDIKYTLSAKGKMLVELLKKSDAAGAKKTLDKIDTILSP